MPSHDTSSVSTVEPAFIQFLQTRLRQPLPGFIGQRRMAPLPARTYLPPEGAKYRDSAVLALLNIPEPAAAPEIVLTVRSGDLKSHSGQISFPGGRVEDNESIIEAALRETFEEIGIPPQHVAPLGELSPLYVPVSTSLIHPIVGYNTEPLRFTLNQGEVEEVFTVAFDEFLDGTKLDTGKWTMLGKLVDVPFWNIHPRVPLWGATAMMVNELVTLYEEFLGKP